MSYYSHTLFSKFPTLDSNFKKNFPHRHFVLGPKNTRSMSQEKIYQMSNDIKDWLSERLDSDLYCVDLYGYQTSGIIVGVIVYFMLEEDLLAFRLRWKASDGEWE